ncbi:MAG: hypothetical protein DRN40_04835 [Thermoplasmata archaeon]|nr:MAG: hypothetical protein DRN28_05590 [Thermoplasmata archaeon]RLF70322.1 MAG: hypothetical protein DRN40_04835 [Thermoplasmata archaeon]
MRECMLAEPTVVIYGIEGYTPAVEPPLRRRLKEMERREDLLKVQWRILREEGRLIVIIMHLKERDVRPLARRFEGEINSLMEERGERCRLKMMLTATITRPIPTPEDQYLLERFYRIVKERREKPLDGSRSTPEGVGEEGLLIIYYLYMLGRREEREVVEDLYPIFQLEPSEVKRILEVLLEKGLVRREGERYRLTWEGLSLIEELSSELFALAEKEVNLEITRYLLAPTGRIEEFRWEDAVEDLISSGVSLKDAVRCVKAALHNLPEGGYIPVRYLQWELKQVLDALDPTGRLSTKYTFFKQPQEYLTVEREGRRYPLTEEVLVEEVLKRLPQGRYLCSSEVLENMIKHLSSVIRHTHMETVPTSFLQEDQEIILPYEELVETIEGFLKRYLPYRELTRGREPPEAAMVVLKDSMHYFHRTLVLLETDPETALKYLLKAFKTLTEAELLSSGVHPTFSMSKNLKMLLNLLERSGVRETTELYSGVLSLYRRYKRKRTILERDEDLIARGQSRAKELELYLRSKGA